MIANGKNFLSLAVLIFTTCKRRITLQILVAYAKKRSPLRLNPYTREWIMKKRSKGLSPGSSQFQNLRRQNWLNSMYQRTD